MTTTRRDFLKTSAAIGTLAIGVPAPAFALRRTSRRSAPLRILILGGTGFIGPYQVQYALDRGHTVTLFNRGRTNPQLFPTVENLVGDRNGDIKSLEGRDWDVVIDNSATNPEWVDLSARLLAARVKRYVFVSSRSVYFDARLATLIGVPGIAAALAALPWLPGTPIVGYAALYIGSSALFLVLAPAIVRARLSPRDLAGLLALLFVLRATFLFTTPIGSDDVYRYMWDGKVQSAGINPYRHAPSAPELQSLHSEALPQLVNHPDIKTPYLPLAQWAFRLAYGLGGEAVWGVKALILVAEALTVQA